MYVSGHSNPSWDWLLKKYSLFPAIQQAGALPRKTFSVGEARDKRYYLEARRIR